MDKGTDKDGEDKNKEGNANAALEKVNEVLASLPNIISGAINKGFEDVGNKKAQTTSDDDEEDDFDEDVDFDELDNKQLADTLTQNILKQIDKKLKGFSEDVNKKVSSTSEEVSKEKLRREVADAREKFKDFDEFKDDIGKLVKQYPNLAVEDLYLLAKQKNPDKVKELEEKRVEEKQKEEKETKSRFGGLTPTSSRETTSKGTMEKGEAAEAAWDEVMSDIPADLIGGTNN